MADNPWLTPIVPIDAAPAVPTGTPLAPPAPSPDPWQTPIGAVDAAPPEPFGPPGPAVPYNFLNAAVHGFTGGLDEPVRSALVAGAYKLGGTTQDFNYPEAAAEVKAGREAYEAAHPYMNLAANLAGSITGPGAKVMGLLSPEANLAERIGYSGLTGAGLGATQGAAENTTSVDEMLRGAKTGGEVGGITGAAAPVLGTIGSAMFPKLSAAEQSLRAVGVNPTPGARGGLPGVVEEGFSHIPLVGAPIKAARTAAREELQTAMPNQGETFVRGAVNEPLAKIGETLPPDTMTGHEMVAKMQTKLSDAFNQAVPTAGGVFDTQASTAVNDALANAKLNLSGRELEEFQNFVQNRILGKVQSGTLSGPDFQNIDSKLGGDAHNFLTRGDPYQKNLGEAYLDLQGKLRDWLQRVSPTNAADLKAANEAWRLAKPVELAAMRTNDPEGYFTTAHLRSGARSASSTPQFAAGGNLMQQFADNADLAGRDLTKAGKILPGSGGLAGDIAGGVATAGGLAGAIFENPALLHSPWFLGSLGVGYPLIKGLYSEPGRKVATGLLNAASAVPPAVGSLGPVGAQVAPGLLSYYNRPAQP